MEIHIKSRNLVYALTMQGILSVALIHTWIIVSFTDIVFMTENILGSILYIVLWCLLGIRLNIYILVLFFVLFLGSFNIIGFNPSIFFIHFGQSVNYGAITIGFQPFSFVLLILSFIFFTDEYVKQIFKIIDLWKGDDK